MADKTIIERLQPSLLDRLTDLEPDHRAFASVETVIHAAVDQRPDTRR